MFICSSPKNKRTDQHNATRDQNIVRAMENQTLLRVMHVFGQPGGGQLSASEKNYHPARFV
jgi:hypothetical protein